MLSVIRKKVLPCLGFELTTFLVTDRRSTTELPWLMLLCYLFYYYCIWFVGTPKWGYTKSKSPLLVKKSRVCYMAIFSQALKNYYSWQTFSVENNYFFIFLAKLLSYLMIFLSAVELWKFGNKWRKAFIFVLPCIH